MDPKRRKQLEAYQFSEYTDCEDRILILLLDDNWGFEELVIGTKKSRGTVNTHIDRLYNKKPHPLIKHVDPYARSVSSPYCLTEQGLEDAKSLGFINSIENEPQITNHFIEQYKSFVAQRIVKHFVGVKVNSESKKAETFLHVDRTFRSISGITVKAIDNDLTSDGFKASDISRLWLIHQGLYIMLALVSIGGKDFFALHPYLTSTQIAELKHEYNLQDPSKALDFITQIARDLDVKQKLEFLPLW